jgi:hypothetical protein
LFDVATIVAFLDVLGFSSYTEEDFYGALRLLGHQEFILRQKLEDGKLHPPESYADSSLAALAEAHLVGSFKHFLPFSDSIFIVSETPDSFARQLSHYLIECLSLVGHVYDDPEDPAFPEAVKVTDLPAGTTHPEKWYPPLWRGGLAAGEVVFGGVTGIENDAPVRIPNIAGPAVVKAVSVERTCRGPRLFCRAGLEEVFGPEIRPFFRRVKEGVNELLWPAFVYNLNNDPQNEMLEFHTLWRPAVGLWKSKRGHLAFEHYDEFLKLIVRSFLCWADVAGCNREAAEKARRWVSADLSEDLIEPYLQR